MIHVVFQEADVAVLEKAIALDASLAGKVVQIKDDYAVGPIENIYQPEGYQQRKAFWEEALQYSPYTAQLDIVDDKMTVFNLIKYLKGDDTASFENAAESPDSTPDFAQDGARELWIWMGQNQHDVCGYYWLMSQLKEYQGQVQVLYLNNLPFINEKGGIFYPVNLHEIQPKEFLKAKRLARAITLSEFEVDPDEWKRLCRENAMVRILEGGKKIVSKGADFYDADILSAVGKEPGKLNKVLHTVLTKMKIKTGDVFLVWRMRQLVEAGKLEITGDWNKGWKELVVKPAGYTAETPEAEPVTNEPGN